MKDDFASMFEQSPAASARKTARFTAGQQIEGTVLAISGGLVVLDVGSSADATMDLLEFEGRTVNVGDVIRATVSNPRSDGPILTLSLGRGGSGIDTRMLELARAGNTPVSGTVTSSNKGGFTVDVSGTRAFCPISQIDTNYVNEPESFVGQTFDFLVMELGEGGRNVVLSRRKLLEAERLEGEQRLLASLQTGALVSGVVKKTIRHGAILDLGGAEGFIPVSEMSRARVDSPEDVVTVGETVQAQVLSLDRTEKGLSIRLSLKALQAPTAQPSIEKDEILKGKVVKHVPIGVIVSTPKGEGLVPTRELALAPGADHRRSYPVDTELDVVLVSRDPSSGKLRFSVDKVAQVEERRNFRDFGQGSDAGKGGLGSLGDVMASKLSSLVAKAHPAPQPGRAKEAAMPREAERAAPNADNRDGSTVRRRR